MDFMDSFKAMALEGFIKNKFGQYLDNGKISVKLDSENSTAEFTATLVGESAPVTINVGKFEIVEHGAEKFLRITEVSSDRKWLDAVLNDHLKGRELRLPSFIASAV